MIGFLMVFGVVGGVDTMPVAPTFSYIGWMLGILVTGLFLIVSGLSKINGR
jgi:hypothetical protein